MRSFLFYKRSWWQKFAKAALLWHHRHSCFFFFLFINQILVCIYKYFEKKKEDAGSVHNFLVFFSHEETKKQLAWFFGGLEFEIHIAFFRILEGEQEDGSRSGAEMKINRDKLRPTFGTGLLQRGFPAECDLWLSELFEIICDVFCSHSNSGNCRRKGGWLPWLTSWVAIASLNCDRKVITQHNHTRRPVFGISS